MSRNASERGAGSARGSRAALVCAGFLALAALTAPAPSRAVDTYRQSNAVLINVTEQDLNVILRSLVRAKGGPELEGTRDSSSRGISDLRYRALLSEPVLMLDEAGQARMTVGIEEGGIEIGRIEREMGKKTAYCENLAAVVKRPIDVEMGFAFRIESDDLHLVPESVSLSKPKKSFRLIKPEQCENTPIPKWLLWWIGKGKIKGKLAELDEVLLKQAQKSAAGLNKNDGFLRKRWEHDLEESSGTADFVDLFPEWLDTGSGSLTVGMATTGSGASAGPPGDTDWIEEMSDRSYVGISETFLKSYLRFAVSDVSETPRKPSGDYRRLFKSSSVFALVPGLRDIEPKDDLSISFALRTAPDIEIGSVAASKSGIDPTLERSDADGAYAADAPRVVIRVLLSNIELKLWKGGDDNVEPDLIGTLAVDSGVVGVVPFLNTIGGVSFALVENEWKLSSSGIEFNEALFAATLQELVFGEVFETRYDPVWGDALTIGDTRFEPRYFRSLGGYLVVELGSS